MSAWNHACCGECWFMKFPEKADEGPPARIRKGADKTPCCYCGRTTGAGIYVRGDPQYIPCGGNKGPEHEE